MLTQLNKTRTDSAGRNYFLCICNECGETKTIRKDHILTTKHKCKPKLFQRIKVQCKSIFNAPIREMKVEARNSREFGRIMKAIEHNYIILT